MAQPTLSMPFLIWDMWMTSQRNYMQMWQRMLTQPRMPFSHSERSNLNNRDVATSDSRNALREQIIGQHEQHEQVIPIGEEALNVSTRRIAGATTRIRRVIREMPVERHVELHDESVVIERQPANGHDGADGESLVEREYAMSDSREVPVVSKQMRLRGHVVLRKQSNNRMEVIRDVIRYADVEVEQPQRMPVVVVQTHHEQHTEPHGGEQPVVQTHHEQHTEHEHRSEQPVVQTHHEQHTEHEHRSEQPQEMAGVAGSQGVETHTEHHEQHDEHHETREEHREQQAD